MKKLRSANEKPVIRIRALYMIALLSLSLMSSKSDVTKTVQSTDVNVCKGLAEIVNMLDSYHPELYYKKFVEIVDTTGREKHTTVITIVPGGTGYIYTQGLGYVGNAYEEPIVVGLTLDSATKVFNDYFSRLKDCPVSEEMAMTYSNDETLHADNFKTVNDAMGEWNSVCLDMYKDDAGKYEVWISVDYFIPTGE